MWRWARSPLLISALLGIPFLVLLAFVTAVRLTPLPAHQIPAATVIYDRTGQPLRRLFVENRIEIPLVAIPQPVMDAIVAVEDDRFYQHKGFDPVGVGRAILHNLRALEVREGGSTITQQLAKNLYLTHERTWTRKWKEAVLTVRLESTYSKREILTLYWNTIYLGSGAYGLEVAAQTYFGKSAQDLTLAESALLAGLPRAPEYYSPLNNPTAAVDRRNLVLDRMQTHGSIGAEEATLARTEPLRLAEPLPPTGEAAYFVDYVIKELQARYPKVAANLYQGGYRIHTALDPVAQRLAEEAVAAEAPKATPDGDGVMQPQVALAALDPNTGFMRALIGGREQRADRNRALEPQQPGSAFKPFVYAQALESHQFSASSTQEDSPIEFPGAVEGAAWRPRNYGDRYSGEPVAMREALRRSLNVVTARWMDVLNPGPVIDLARRMGIESPMPENLTIGLGSAAVTPLELTRAYAPLANGGFAVQPVGVLRIEDRNGDVVARAEAFRTPILDPGVSFVVTDMLKEVVRPGGTAGQVAGYMSGRPVAGKTGTSDESRDAWFVGYSPELVTGVWVGHDDNRPARWEGGTAAAPVWAYFMSKVLHGMPHRDWSPPPNVTSRTVCSLTGQLPNLSCPERPEWFLAGTEPTTVDATLHWDRLVPEMPSDPWMPNGWLGGPSAELEEMSPPVPAIPLIPVESP